MEAPYSVIFCLSAVGLLRRRPAPPCDALMVRPPCSMQRNMLSHRPGQVGSSPVCLSTTLGALLLLCRFGLLIEELTKVSKQLLVNDFYSLVINLD